jgi:hypothetical protein
MKRTALVMCCAAFSRTVSAGLLGPTTFDECVLANMKGVGSDVGARMVAAACLKQFPPGKPVEKAAQPAAAVPPTTPVFPAKCYRTEPGSNATSGFDPDCFIPDPQK